MRASISSPGVSGNASRWFDDGEGSEELAGLRQLLSPDSLGPVKEGASGLLDAVEESRNRQARLSDFLQENIREAIEFLLEDVSKAGRTSPDLFTALVRYGDSDPLTDVQANEALYQATVRVVMRLVVCLFAESRPELRFNGPVYDQAYGVRTLYERLEEAVRYEGGVHTLFPRNTAWPRLMALFRLIHDGSLHPDIVFPKYGGGLFRPGAPDSPDPVSRALHILERRVQVGDATIHVVLRKLLRAKLPVIRGRTKTYVEGPVDYSDLRTQVIGLIYEGLLDYRLKRTDDSLGPMVFLNIGRQPVLPLRRLEDMLAHDRNGLKNLLTTLRKEQVTASASDVDEGSDEASEDAEQPEEQEEIVEEEAAENDAEPPELEGSRIGEYLATEEAARRWARDAVVLAGLSGRQRARETDREYQARLDAESGKLIKRVTVPGEFYLVRAGNTRKGSGTFYTRPELAVPTVYRTLEPLCYDKGEDGILTPKPPETILGLKMCDPACGSASFLVASLDYLTDALYRSLCVHRRLDDPEVANRLTLPLGQPRSGRLDEDLVKFPPNDPYHGDNFEAWVKARLRRYVVERCLYGVDINPLAVELARVSLWIATLDPGLPFSFLDHKIKVGNSLVGCWLDRVKDYPLKAWEREGGDGKDGPRSQRIETLLKGEKVGNRRPGNGQIKQEMRKLIESRFQGYRSFLDDPDYRPLDVVARLRDDYQKLHDQPIQDPSVQETRYREIEASESRQRLKRAMDEWCVVWFWPTDKESIRHVPTPETFHAEPSEARSSIISRLSLDLKFFHWELEFPDVFTPQRSGFDAVVGNPPWEVMKPNSKEFFTDYDPIYRGYEKQKALQRQDELFEEDGAIKERWDEYNGVFKALSNWVKSEAEPFEVSLARGNKGGCLSQAWAKERLKRKKYAPEEHPFRYQGSADLNSYKLFLELAYALLSARGRLGMIIPSGLYTDSGTKDLRELFLDKSGWTWLFSFENRKGVFNIDRRFKFACTVVSQQKIDEPLRTAFMVHDLKSWEQTNPPVIVFDKGLIPLFSPRSKSIPEVRTKRDLDICCRIYDHSFRIGDNAPGWEITYAREFDLTNDSKLFQPLERLEAKGYKSDVFGRWVGRDGDVALPLYEGRMIGQFDFSQKGWVRGKGRSAVWREIPFDHKTVEPQYLMDRGIYYEWPDLPHGTKLAFMDITSATNARTMIATVADDIPFGNSSPILWISGFPLEKTLLLSALLNSLTFDFVTRQRTGGLHLNWFIVDECPLPRMDREDGGNADYMRLVINVAQLTFLHRMFAPEWLKLKQVYDLPRNQWKHWWAVTEADRLRLRVETDALCATLYGLDVDDFAWIVRNDPDDPKGFWRVDKDLPFRERLTGLAAAAFRALKEGKWSAESAAGLSNDEFFEILGIPPASPPPTPRACPDPSSPSATAATSGGPRPSRSTTLVTAGPGTTAGTTPWPCSATRRPCGITSRGRPRLRLTRNEQIGRPAARPLSRNPGCSTEGRGPDHESSGQAPR